MHERVKDLFFPVTQQLPLLLEAQMVFLFLVVLEKKNTPRKKKNNNNKDLTAQILISDTVYKHHNTSYSHYKQSRPQSKMNDTVKLKCSLSTDHKWKSASGGEEAE